VSFLGLSLNLFFPALLPRSPPPVTLAPSSSLPRRYSKELSYNKTVRQLFFNGRHMNILFLLTLQYALDIPPALVSGNRLSPRLPRLSEHTGTHHTPTTNQPPIFPALPSSPQRSNIDFVIAFREPILENRIRLHKNFFGLLPEFSHFEQVLSACTADFECLVINNRIKSNDWQDCVFYYKAKIRTEPWRIGSPAYWQFHFEHYDGAGGDDDDQDWKPKKQISVKKA